MKVFGKGIIHHKGEFIPFVEGVIETEDRTLVGLLMGKGYETEGYEEEEKAPKDMNTKELQAYLKSEGIEYTKGSKKEELLALLVDQEEEAE